MVPPRASCRIELQQPDSKSKQQAPPHPTPITTTQTFRRSDFDPNRIRRHSLLTAHLNPTSPLAVNVEQSSIPVSRPGQAKQLPSNLTARGQARLCAITGAKMRPDMTEMRSGALSLRFSLRRGGENEKKRKNTTLKSNFLI
ncbi:hypothetical protein ACLB2K_047149 [Fragaria x ananassa]